MIEGWDSYWNVPRNVTIDSIKAKIDETSKRFLEVKTNNEKFVVFGQKEPVPESIQLLYPTIYATVYETLKDAPRDICYSGDSDLVFMIILWVIQTMPIYRGRNTIVYTHVPPVLIDPRLIQENVTRSNRFLIEVRHLKYPNMPSEIRHIRVDQLTNYDTRFFAYKYLGLEFSLELQGKKCYLHGGHSANIVDLLPAFLELKKDPRQPFMFDMEIYVNSEAVLWFVYMTLIILLFPKFSLNVVSDPLTSRLVQYALDHDMITDLKFTTSRSLVLYPLRVPPLTRSLNAFVYRYFPDTDIPFIIESAHFGPIIESLRNRVAPLKYVSVRTKNIIPENHHIRPDDIEKDLCLMLINVAKTTTAIGRIKVEFSSFRSILEDRVLLKEVNDIYKQEVYTALSPQRMIGQDTCFLDLTHDQTELDFRVLYEFMEQKMIGKPRPIQMFVLRKYMWAFYKKQYLDPFLDHTWRPNSYVRLYSTVEEYKNSTIANKVLGNKTVFDAWFDMEFKANSNHLPKGMLKELREFTKDTETPMLWIKPGETLHYLCWVFCGIVERVADRKADAHKWFKDVGENVTYRHDMFTKNRQEYEDSLQRFQEAKPIFMMRMHCKNLYYMASSEEGRNFIRQMQRNPSDAMAVLNVFYYLTSQGYHPNIE